MCVNNVLAAIIHVSFCLVGDLPKRQCNFVLHETKVLMVVYEHVACHATSFIDHHTNTLKFNKTVLSHAHTQLHHVNKYWPIAYYRVHMNVMIAQLLGSLNMTYIARGLVFVFP
jgi:hypothetical protein